MQTATFVSPPVHEGVTFLSSSDIAFAFQGRPMYLHPDFNQFWMASLLIGFLSGIVMEASSRFIRSGGKFRSLANGIPLLVSGIIWGGCFVFLYFVAYNDSMPEDSIKVLMVRLGLVLPLGMLVFELCSAAIRRFQAHRNR